MELLSARVSLDAARNNKTDFDFIIPVIIPAKGATYIIFIDAWLLKSRTDISKYHFPLIPVQVLIPRIDGTIFKTLDFSTVCHQVPLTSDTPTLDHFVVGNEQFNYKRGFYGLKALPGLPLPASWQLFSPRSSKRMKLSRLLITFWFKLIPKPKCLIDFVNFIKLQGNLNLKLLLTKHISSLVLLVFLVMLILKIKSDFKTKLKQSKKWNVLNLKKLLWNC